MTIDCGDSSKEKISNLGLPYQPYCGLYADKVKQKRIIQKALDSQITDKMVRAENHET